MGRQPAMVESQRRVWRVPDRIAVIPMAVTWDMTPGSVSPHTISTMSPISTAKYPTSPCSSSGPP
eukprot:9910289-Lingulodinium_polyedra.AAC.1